MAVILTGGGIAPKLRGTELIIFALGDSDLTTGAWVELSDIDATSAASTYEIQTSYGIRLSYAMETETDEETGDEIDYYVPNYACIEVDATGYSKLIIDAYTKSTYTDSYVGWDTSVDTRGGFASNKQTVAVTTNTAFEFDISGQGTIYIELCSNEVTLYVTGIRLEN